MEVQEVRDLITELLYGEAWFVPFLFIAAICIVLVKIEKFSAVFIIPCLLILEGLYYTHNDGSGSMIWAMISSLLLIFFVATMAVLERNQK
jgi:hypothetical protein